ncbi:MAG: dipeptide/oligopeptide/nickel ABC transporter permease/ATP-binding protein [Hyphomicrobiales bacterium]
MSLWRRSRMRGGALAAVAAIFVMALVVPLLPLPDPLRIDVAHRLMGPSAPHPLGQDEYGRDVLARLLWGARVSLAVAFSASAAACAVGIALGLVGGFMGRAAELFAVRSMDVVLCFPPLLLALLAVTLLGPGASTLIPVLAVLYLPGFVRVVYAGVLGVRSQDYVEAMRALGAGPFRIMLRTILPNVSGPVLVQFSLAAASAVVLESGLSFLGLGVVPPAPSWGLMIGAARATIAQAPLLLLWPCLALSLTILAMNALCDALRDAFDPHQTASRARRRGVMAALLPGLLPATGPVLEVRDLSLEIETPLGPIHPVRDVSLNLRAGETLAIVGESGSGKSLTGLAIMGLLPQAARLVAGTVWLEGRDLARLDEASLRKLRGERLAMTFQDPLSSLNPVHRVGAQIVEALQVHRPQSARAAWAEAVAALRRVGIADPARRAQAFPHELSGGMRQRAMIAMAIVNHPRLLIADEPTTALDVTIQAQILDLLAGLRRESGMALIFISHSLPVVSEIADRIVVMYAGEVVEQGPAQAVLAAPLHPYTIALLRSAPPEDGTLPVGIAGLAPLPQALPAGCAFAPRCAWRADACEAQRPPLVEARPGRLTRCLRWPDLCGNGLSSPASPGVREGEA